MIQIPGYHIVRQLGRGGMATVYLAIQESVDREVALKIMAPQLLIDPNFGERFLREARIAARLHHRHVVGVHDVGKYGDLHYIAMEYLAGGPILKKDGGPRDVPFSLRVVREIATALGYAHGKGFVHRDIKPDNVLLRDDGTAALTDFGIARASDSATRMTRTGAVIGTPHYMSPEQARGKPIDGRADLYSLGVVLYELLVGRVPYHAEDSLAVGIMHITEPIPALPEHLSSLQPLLEVMLAKKPDERYQTGEELSSAVREYEVGIAKGELPSLLTPTDEQRERILASLPPLKPATPPVLTPQEPFRPISNMPLQQTRPVESPLPPTRPMEQPLPPTRPMPAPRTQQHQARSPSQYAESVQRAEPSLGRIEDFAAAMDNRRHTRYREEPRSRKGWWIAATFVVLGAMAAGAYFNQDRLRSLIPATSLNKSLAQAEKALNEGRLVGRPDSAAALYRAVITLDQDNSQAQAGLKRVGERLLDQARADLANGHLKQARENAAQAREILQGGPALEELEGTLRAAENRQLQSGTLLDKANAALQAGRLIGTEDSAAAYFQRMLEAEPGNALARKGIADVQGALSRQARAALIQRRYDEAQARISEIERLGPDYAELAGFKAMLADSHTQETQDLEAKLTQAEVQSRKGQLIQPAGNNAFELYKQVLAKDPQNARARAGMAVAAKAWLSQANLALAANDTGVAQRALNQAEVAGAPANEVATLRAQLREIQEKADIAAHTTTPSADQQAQIDAYLTKADAALQTEALIEPPGANAYDLYRAAMALDRNNARARAGIAAIPAKAKERFEKALADAQPNTARGYLDAITTVSPSDPNAEGMRARLGHVYIQRAEQQIAENQKVEAARSLNKARELAPNDPALAEAEAKL